MTHQPQSAVFNSLTEPRRTEEQLRRDARRDAFRVKLNDTLRALTDPVQIQAEAARMIGERLKVSWAFYSEIETIEGEEYYVVRQDYHAEDVPSSVGHFRADSFGKFVYNELCAGNTFIVSDMATDERFIEGVRSAYTAIHIQSWLATPLIKGGRLIGTFGVQHKTAREWTPDEISLIEDTAERTWAVVERARSEAALRESEEKFRTLFETMDEGYALCELVRDSQGKAIDYRILEVNRAFEAHSGFEPAKVIGRLRTEINPEIDKRMLEAVARVIETGKPVRLEQYNKGLNRWLSMGLFPHNGDQFVELFSDITKRKQAEEALRKSQEQLALSVEAAKMGIFEWTSDGHKIRLSDGSIDVFGLDPQKPFSTSDESYALIHPDDIENHKEIFERAGKFAEDYYNEFRIIRPDDKKVAWIAEKGKSIRDTETGITIIRGVHWDITDKKNAEEALRESEENFRTLFNSIDEGFYLCEVVFNNKKKPIEILYLQENPAAIRMMGKSFIGRTLRQVDPTYEPHWYEILGDVARTGKSKRLVRYSAPDNKWFDFYTTKVDGENSDRVAVVFQDITERKRAEEAMRQSEEKYRTLFNSIDEGYCLAKVIFDDKDKPVDLLIMEINQAWGHQTKLGDITGQRMSSVAPNIGAHWMNTFGNVALTGIPVRTEEYSATSDRWFSLFASRVGGENSHTLALVFDDVTERKKAQEQIERTNQKLNEILSSIQDDFYVIDRDWVFIYANKLFTSKLGKEPEDFVGNNMWELFPKHLGTALEENFRAAMEKREVRRFEIPGRYTNAWYRMTVFPSTEGITVLGTEITDRKLAEEALRQSDARYQMLHETLMDALVQVNMEGYIVSCNDIFCQLVGYSHEELSALTYRDLTPKRWRAFEAGIVRDQILTRGFSDVYEKEYQRKDGKIIPVELRTVLMRDPSGQPDMMWAIVRDITERKHAEEVLYENERQLQLLNESLEQKVEEKTAELRRLASDLTKAEQRERNRISHILHDDLQQRIYSIQMQLRVLQNELGQDNESAQNEALDLEKQVKEILEIARHLSIDLNPPILRGEGLAHAVNWLAAQMKQRYGLSVEIQADEPFTIPDEELHILLFNCIRELLFNVVKHAQASQAVVTLQQSGVNLRIEVRDNGRGFPVEIVERQMQKAISTNEDLPVSFGISTLRHQLSLYGGSVEIQSTPGAGTQIILTIPISENVQKV